ncbi:MAG: 30S ribosomal protein S13, partial [archaeon]
MAEEKIKVENKANKKPDKSNSPTAEEKAEKKRKFEEENKAEFLVRILGYDIPGSRGLMTGLLRIKGISWAISNAVCLKLNMQKNKKISDLSKDEIQK